MKDPLFLERQGYRRRRLQDTARLIPVLGLFLFMVPLMGNPRFGNDLAMLLVYVFVAWGLLIVISAIASRALERQITSEREEERRG